MTQAKGTPTRTIAVATIHCTGRKRSLRFLIETSLGSSDAAGTGKYLRIKENAIPMAMGTMSLEMKSDSAMQCLEFYSAASMGQLHNKAQSKELLKTAP
jgi:hypothetical protein